MSQTSLPTSFWGHALETAAFIINHTTSNAIGKTPYEIWTGQKLIMSFLRIWSCEVHIKRLTSDKLTSKTDKYLFVRYPKETKGYFYIPNENKVFVTRKTVFLKKEFIFKKENGSKVQLQEIQEPQNPIEDKMEVDSDSQRVVESESTTQEPRRSGRIRHEPERYGFLVTDDKDLILVDQNEPTTSQEAIENQESKKWLGAMDSEMQSMYDNQVWTWLIYLKVGKPLVASGFSN